ncbi:hypothetical protein [Amycolatopsis sp. PS_44_ISF1]|uniref:hypothetical protein n=1 Tax=Amycolatopsis sp. PS_44_ISF1 TaxID=2974917 RepID=UPI0028DD6700|nr:hypothetical protein [Amycolatopsis sp. PS_44_ISF1]MDT8911739.1 hypothetical protein [Amycolatopsis sp. PS_44_ISF1]
MGELPASEVDRLRYAVHFNAKDTRNHRYDREHLAVSDRPYSPECSRYKYAIPARWAWRGELSEELGDDRDRTRDCPVCFRLVRPSARAGRARKRSP